MPCLAPPHLAKAITQGVEEVQIPEYSHLPVLFTLVVDEYPQLLRMS
jgi:hypothetical protein